MDLYFKRVTSTLKSPTGKPWTVELGPKVVLVGDNGDGKSAIVQSIEALTTSEVDDMGNSNNVRDPSLLIEHAFNSDAPGASVHIEGALSNDAEVEWDLTRRDDGSLPQKPAWKPCAEIEPDEVLPMRLVREVLYGEPKKGQAAILRWSGATIAETDILGGLPGTLHARLQDIGQSRAPDGSPLDRLLATVAYGKEQIERQRAEILANKRVVDGLAAALGSTPPLAADIEQAEQTIHELAAAIGAERQRLTQTAQAPAPQDLAQLYAYLQHCWQAGGAAQGRLTQLQEEWNQLQAALAAQPPAVDLAGLHHNALALLQYAQTKGSVQCFACGFPGLENPEHVARLHAFHTERSHAAPDPRTLRVEALRQELHAAQAAVDEAARVYQQAHVAYQQAQAAQTAGPVPTSEPLLDGPIQAAEAELATLEAENRRRIALVAQWAQVAEARNRIVELEMALRTDEAFFGACADIVKRLSAQAAQNFQKQVQLYLPDDWLFSVDTSGNRRVRVGLKSPTGSTVLGATLSGGQRTAVDAAVAMAVAFPTERLNTGKKGRKPGQPRLRIVVLPDRSRSDKRLTTLMRQWTSWPGQIILTTTERPAGRPPAGWQYVDVQAVMSSAQTEPIIEAAEARPAAGDAK